MRTFPFPLFLCNVFLVLGKNHVGAWFWYPVTMFALFFVCVGSTIGVVAMGLFLVEIICGSTLTVFILMSGIIMIIAMNVAVAADILSDPDDTEP